MSETIQGRIQAGMLAALKSGDRGRKDILSYLLSELKASAKARQIQELPDNDAIALLQKQSKKVQETLDAAEKGGRTDAAAQSATEIAVIQEFLPNAPSSEAVEALAREVIADLGASSIRDMGRVMAEVPNRLTGVDKTTLSGVVKRLLTSV